jgi:hypothetical protein
VKDQYFGDVNDYRKYGLLRAIAKTGLRVGVCWMLTPADDSSDGRLTTYWQEPARWRKFDPGLFSALRRCDRGRAPRSISMAARWKLIPDALYFPRLLGDSAVSREAFFSAASVNLSAADLLFFDPDNGLEVASVPRGRKRSSKYLYWQEVESTFRAGHSVLIYQHWQRTHRDAQVKLRISQLRQRIGPVVVFTFKTSFVLLILAAHPRHVQECQRAINAIAKEWTDQFETKEWPAA